MQPGVRAGEADDDHRASCCVSCKRHPIPQPLSRSQLQGRSLPLTHSLLCQWQHQLKMHLPTVPRPQQSRSLAQQTPKAMSCLPCVIDFVCFFYFIFRLCIRVVFHSILFSSLSPAILSAADFPPGSLSSLPEPFTSPPLGHDMFATGWLDCQSSGCVHMASTSFSFSHGSKQTGHNGGVLSCILSSRRQPVCSAGNARYRRWS